MTLDAELFILMARGLNTLGATVHDMFQVYTGQEALYVYVTGEVGKYASEPLEYASIFSPGKMS